jgi:1,4-dihydroxy-6-naphthoate synthase
MAATLTETFTLGHSPDPDDAFMFYAMATNKIDLRGYRFEHRLEDIQTLNERAMRGELHISAVSIHACAYFGDKYLLLPCGASMGDGYGPLLVEKRRTPSTEHRTPNEDVRESLRGRIIAVPGTMTSAFLALQLFLGQFKYIVVPFDQIFETVRSGRAEAGLIIHEGQLTYAQSGFTKIIDLGEWWKERTGLPLPLGGNVLRKDIPREIQHDLAAIPYARDMGSDLASKFIGMYVNEFTRDYGEVGREAIRRFLGEAREHGYIDREISIEFVT